MGSLCFRRLGLHQTTCTETFNVSTPLTSVVQENAAMTFCCESPGMFSGTTNVHQHEGEQKMMNCHCYVFLSFNTRARGRLVCSKAAPSLHLWFCTPLHDCEWLTEIQTTENSVRCTRTGAVGPSSSTVGYNERCINLPIQL